MKTKRQRMVLRIKEERGCEECKSTDNLTVHHIVPRSFGGRKKFLNLKVLCRDCHNKIHGIKKNDSFEVKGE
ncbi:hypothetical protein LCGC14_1714160 [marine sediment metagenome]|uniref:HNH nuclease domain-containing protein n=1 Tax=marine sediment metagenome TaxID=412755 RepID=A0A0F9I1R8_9ZZZZ